MNIKNIKDTNSWEFFWMWILGVTILMAITYYNFGNKTLVEVMNPGCIESGGYIVQDMMGPMTDIVFHCEYPEESE